MMDINEIREYLPHRYPFLLVDRVVDLDVEAQRIRAYKNVSINEPFFNGHFPAHPIMPGVLIIEALAQAGGVFDPVIEGERKIRAKDGDRLAHLGCCCRGVAHGIALQIGAHYVIGMHHAQYIHVKASKIGFFRI